MAMLVLAGIATLGATAVRAAAAPPTPGPRAVTTSDGHYFVVYEPRPDPIPLNQLFEVKVSVYDGTDHSQPVDKVAVTVGAMMPEHNHGMNTRPTVTRTAAGEWVAKGLLFHMAGRWQLMVAVLGTEHLDRATFELLLD